MSNLNLTSPSNTGFVLFTQANLQKKPEATSEFAQYINLTMKKYDMGRNFVPSGKKQARPIKKGNKKHRNNSKSHLDGMSHSSYPNTGSPILNSNSNINSMVATAPDILPSSSKQDGSSHIGHMQTCSPNYNEANSCCSSISSRIFNYSAYHLRQIEKQKVSKNTDFYKKLKEVCDRLDISRPESDSESSNNSNPIQNLDGNQSENYTSTKGKQMKKPDKKNLSRRIKQRLPKVGKIENSLSNKQGKSNGNTIPFTSPSNQEGSQTSYTCPDGMSSTYPSMGTPVLDMTLKCPTVLSKTLKGPVGSAPKTDTCPDGMSLAYPNMGTRVPGMTVKGPQVISKTLKGPTLEPVSSELLNPSQNFEFNKNINLDGNLTSDTSITSKHSKRKSKKKRKKFMDRSSDSSELNAISSNNPFKHETSLMNLMPEDFRQQTKKLKLHEISSNSSSDLDQSFTSNENVQTLPKRTKDNSDSEAPSRKRARRKRGPKVSTPKLDKSPHMPSDLSSIGKISSKHTKRCRNSSSSSDGRITQKPKIDLHSIPELPTTDESRVNPEKLAGSNPKRNRISSSSSEDNKKPRMDSESNSLPDISVDDLIPSKEEDNLLSMTLGAKDYQPRKEPHDTFDALFKRTPKKRKNISSSDEKKFQGKKKQKTGTKKPKPKRFMDETPSESESSTCFKPYPLHSFSECYSSAYLDALTTNRIDSYLANKAKIDKLKVKPNRAVKRAGKRKSPKPKPVVFSDPETVDSEATNDLPSIPSDEPETIQAALGKIIKDQTTPPPNPNREQEVTIEDLDDLESLDDYQSERHILDPILEKLSDEASAENAFAERLDLFLQESAKDAKGVQEELHGLLGDQSKPSAFLAGLTEFHWNKNTKTIPNLKGHKLIVDRSAKPRPRAAIFASSNLDVWQCDQYTGKDIATLCWLVQGAPFKRVYVTSVYMPDLSNDPDPAVRATPVINTKLEALVRRCIKEKAALVILTDSNSHHTSWHMPKSNARGNKVHDFLVTNSLRVLNEGPLEKNWTWSGHRLDKDKNLKNCQTIVDLSIISPNLNNFTHDWKVANGAPSSDHRSTQFIIGLEGYSIEKKRNFRQADWKKFVQHLESKLNPCEFANWTNGDLQREFEVFLKDIYTALDLSCPATKREVRIPSIPWWDKELAKLKRKRDMIQRSIRWAERNPRKKPRKHFTRDDLKDAQKQYSKACRRARRKGWQSFITGCDTVQKVATLSRILKRTQDPEVGLMTDENGETLDAQESIEVLVNEHFPGNSESPTFKKKASINKKRVRITNGTLGFINKRSVKTAIDGFEPFKGPGVDNLNPVVLQHMGPFAIARLTNIYKASLALGTLPEDWLKVRSIFIPKSGKDRYDVPTAYRPISLMSFFTKTMERLLLWRDERTSLKQNPMHKNQHGFRKGMSCSTSLSTLTEEIEHALKNDLKVLLVNLDIKGAFSNVQYDDIVRTLQERGTDQLTINWIEYFLKHRKIYVDYKGIMVKRFTTMGCPQGAIYSPTLWNINNDSLHELYDNGPVSSNGYADDISLYVIGNDLEEMAQTMQEHGIEPALQWGRDHKLEFSCDKSKAIVFTKTPEDKYVPPSQLTLNGEVMKYVKEAKILGVILDWKLKWTPHVLNKIEKCKKLLMKFHNAQGKVWGLHPNVALWAYTGIVRPAFTHGCLVWVNVTRHKGIQDKLRSFQNLGLRMLGFTRKSTPHRGLEVMTHTMPLHLHIRMLASIEHVRTCKFMKYSHEEMKTNVQLRRGHRQCCRDYLLAAGVKTTEVELDKIPMAQNWSQKYFVDLETMDPWNKKAGKPKIQQGISEIF